MSLGPNDRESCPSPGAAKTHRALGEGCARCGVEGHARPLSLSEVVARRRAALLRAETAHTGRPVLALVDESL